MIKTRTLTISDIKDIVRIENEAWGKELSASRNVLIERLKRFPEGFIGAYVEDRLAGMIYGHPINNVGRTWHENSCKEAFDSKGDIYYIVNLGISEAYLKRGIGSRLLEETKKLRSRF